MAKVQQLINSNGNPAANQFVIKSGDKVFFQSYNSMVAMWDKEKRKLYISHYWDYSNTTRKHFYIFLRKYTNISGNRQSVERGIADGTIGIVSEECLSY
jgi:hypothetical protein